VLEAVKAERKVAWILLEKATVAGMDGGALTLSFANEGYARGFASSGYDADLSRVLKAMFGISPQIRGVSGPAAAAGATTRPRGAAPGGPVRQAGSGGHGAPAPSDYATPPPDGPDDDDDPGYSPPARGGGPSRAAGPRARDTGAGNTGAGNTGAGNTGAGNTGAGNTGAGNTGAGNTGAGNTGAPGRAGEAGGSRAPGGAGRAGGGSSGGSGRGPRGGSGSRAQAGSGAESRPQAARDPDDLAAEESATGQDASQPGGAPGSESLSGLDLIQRELGGKIIDEFGSD
jgi:hypothetical protein